jgi:hypothetical protein
MLSPGRSVARSGQSLARARRIPRPCVDRATPRLAGIEMSLRRQPTFAGQLRRRVADQPLGRGHQPHLGGRMARARSRAGHGWRRNQHAGLLRAQPSRIILPGTQGAAGEKALPRRRKEANPPPRRRPGGAADVSGGCRIGDDGGVGAQRAGAYQAL